MRRRQDFEEYVAAMEECGVPEHMHHALAEYLTDGFLVGGFLSAVLTNDLKDAVGRADHININALPNYVRFLYNHAPSTAWGSVEAVDAWIVAMREQLEMERAEGR